jgi:hypothetical protein
MLILAGQKTHFPDCGTGDMKQPIAMLIASLGVFLGSLLSDILLGDGIQSEDVQQAAMVALIAAAIQWALNRRSR